MNDFTKGELGEIKSCVYFEGWKSDGSENANQHLLDKIQSLIDNYCEHPENNICMECLSATCEKCNKLWEIKN